MAESGIDRYLQVWTEQLTRGLTATLREVPVVSCSRARHLAGVDVTQTLWWQVALRSREEFLLWIGAREGTWSRAGKLQWVRILETASLKTAEVLNPDLVKPLDCGAAQVVRTAPKPDGLLYAVAGIRLQRTELPSLLIAMEPAARSALDFQSRMPVLTPMLQSLLELELPMSVALGRTKLPIGEVLKITSGSVIHLQGHTGDEVEVIVHGTVVAKGQVVSTKGNYGVRIKEIISPLERLHLCTPDE